MVRDQSDVTLDERRDRLGVDPRRLVFMDATGASTSMMQTHGRPPEGERVEWAVPRSWTPLPQICCGLRLGGATAPFVFQKATGTAAFETYAESVLAPQLRPGDVVIWNNLSPHEAATVLKAIRQADAEVSPLPASSPAPSLPEVMFSKVKGEMRSVLARTTDAIGSALRGRPRKTLNFPTNRGRSGEMV